MGKTDSPMSLSSLKFDKSNSARIRFIGNPIVVGIHWLSESDKSIDHIKLICPESIGILGHKCSSCKQIAKSDRWLTLGFDCDAQRFCTFLGHELVFKSIHDQCKNNGIPLSMLSNGNGPDFLLQKTGARTVVLALKETIGKTPLGWIEDKKPDINRVLKGIERSSHWKSGIIAK